MKVDEIVRDIVDNFLVDDAILTKKVRIHNAKNAIAKALRDLVEECAKTAENHESSGHCCEDCPCSYYGEEVAKKMRELSR